MNAEARRRLIEGFLQEATPLLLESYSPTPGADEERRRALLGTNQKTSHRDIVTHFDRKIEAFLHAKIQAAFPGETIIGEEAASSGYDWTSLQGIPGFWVIDPIDGTTNFSRAYPFFCSTIAYVEHQGNSWSVLCGATWDPTRREMFSAHRGGGATLNGKPLRVSSVEEPKQALLTTGFASSRTHGEKRSFELFRELSLSTLGVRRDGAAALDLAYVAAGRIDAYWERGLSPWDTAAGLLLVSEAGGRCSHHGGENAEVLSGEVLATNGALHAWMLESLQKS
jgi:myo-inositol-1(or 4)-monophosphatase